VTSEPGKGSVFTVRLPEGREHINAITCHVDEVIEGKGRRREGFKMKLPLRQDKSRRGGGEM